MRARLQGSYPMAVAIALVGLCPYVVVTTAFLAISDLVGSDLSASPTTVQLAGGLGNAGYAVGAVVAAQLAQRFVQRRLFLTFTPGLAVGSALAGLAPGPVLFTVARVLEGLAAGGMLISALPMLLTRFGVRRVAVSAGVVNLGMFGASALGPTVGGLVAAHHGWRGLFWVVAGCALLAWVAALLGYAAFDPPDPDRPVDRPALGLVVLTTVATFFGTAMLTGHGFGSALVLAPLVVGLLALAALVVVEDRQEEALIPVRSLVTQLPVTGTMAAMVGGAVFVSATELMQTELTGGAGRSPTSAAWLFWPMPLGALAAAVLLAVLFRTRYLPLLVDAGFVALVVAVVLLLGLDAATADGVVLAASVLLGFGAGATVSPGLFLTGLGLPGTQIGRAFAMVQLLRAIATYAVGPVVLHLALGRSSLASGTHAGMVVLLVLAGAGLVGALVIPWLSGARLRRPDLESWLDGGQALPSPTTAVHLRPGVHDDDAAPLRPGR